MTKRTLGHLGPGQRDGTAPPGYPYQPPHLLVAGDLFRRRQSGRQLITREPGPYLAATHARVAGGGDRRWRATMPEAWLSELQLGRSRRKCRRYKADGHSDVGRWNGTFRMSDPPRLSTIVHLLFTQSGP